MSLVAAISGLLTMCGVVSIRMFLPVFFYLVLMKITAFFPEWAPESMRNMLVQTPEILLHPVSMTVIGLLAAGECIAMYRPEVKEFMTEQLDLYVKPVIAGCLALGFFSTDPSEAMEKLAGPEIHQAAFSLTAVWVVLVGSCTHGFCRWRSKVLEFIRSIDPDNVLHLQTAENILEDLLVFGLVVICILLPLLALAITLGTAGVVYFVRKLVDDREKKNSRPCPHCRAGEVKTMVFKAGFICPVCRKEQDQVFPLAGLGEVAAVPLDKTDPLSVEEHRMDLRRVKRCPACASRLERRSLLPGRGLLNFGSSGYKADPDMICPCCGERIWDEAILQKYLDRPDGWAWFIFITAFLLCLLISFTLIIPMAVVIVITALVYQPFTVMPLNRYNGGFQRFRTRFVRNLLKLLLIVPLLLLSFVPFAGVIALLPMVIHYMMVRKSFVVRIRRMIKESVCHA